MSKLYRRITDKKLSNLFIFFFKGGGGGIIGSNFLCKIWRLIPEAEVEFARDSN